MPIRVLICDDIALIRELVRLALEKDPDIQVVGEASNGEEAVQAAGRLTPDIVVLDLNMPVMPGLEALPLIKEAAPDTRVIVLSGFEARFMEEQARSRGADHYVEKDGDLRVVLRAVKHVASR